MKSLTEEEKIKIHNNVVEFIDAFEDTDSDECEENLRRYVQETIPSILGIDSEEFEDACPECSCVGHSWTPKFVLYEIDVLLGLEEE